MAVIFNRFRRWLAVPVGGFLLLTTTSTALIAQSVVKPIAEGVTLVQDVKTDSKAPMVYTALKIDPSKPGIKIQSSLGGDTVIEDGSAEGREAVSSYVKRRGVLAGVNADFFPFTGDPLGMAITDGEFVSEPFDGRAVFGIRPDGKAVFDRLVFTGELAAANGTTYKLHGLNRTRGKDEVVLYAPVFGTSTRTTLEGIEIVISPAESPIKINKPLAATVESIQIDAKSSPIPTGKLVLSAAGAARRWIEANVKQGETLTIRPTVKSYTGQYWDDVTQAVGGAVWLLKDGSVYLDPEDEKMSASFVTARHPRTGVGVTAAGEILMVVADGRQTISQGMNLKEFAELMKSLGAVTAVNLDGGGSSTLSVKGMVVNSPSGGKERPVANMLSVIAQASQIASIPIKFSVEELTAQSGQPQQLSLLNPETGASLTPQETANVIWGTTGGIGLVDQNGLFRPIKANAGTVTAVLGDKIIELPVKVEPGPAAKLSASFDKDATGASNRGQVTASVIDAEANAVTNSRIAIKVTGGIPDFPEGQPDASGKVIFGITWDETIPAAKRCVVVTSGSLPPVTLKP